MGQYMSAGVDKFIINKKHIKQVYSIILQDPEAAAFEAGVKRNLAMRSQIPKEEMVKTIQDTFGDYGWDLDLLVDGNLNLTGFGGDKYDSAFLELLELLKKLAPYVEKDSCIYLEVEGEHSKFVFDGNKMHEFGAELMYQDEAINIRKLISQGLNTGKTEAALRQIKKHLQRF